MARYHKHLRYHEDTTEKHPLTVEEILFLMELQKEMNTQDQVGQADPRFWVIKGTEREYGIETGYEDGANLVDDNGCATVATDMKSAMEHIRDDLLDEISGTDGIQRKIEMTAGCVSMDMNTGQPITGMYPGYMKIRCFSHRRRLRPTWRPMITIIPGMPIPMR